MSYLVLARKWRPKRFAELVGQEHVVRALSNALESGRVHHAYLFTGTRGVGKTTIARIFAKSLNCEKGSGADPCGECETCLAIDAGRYIDLLEIDAASNTGVDNVRELIDNAQYMPSRGRCKVYLIDEVHMLSKQAFNALLKTLEEPPEHVKFLFATTDPEKLLVTVLSRCLQFNLKRLDEEQIGGQIEKILGAEGIAFEPAAVRQIARAADGSLRDGLSLLDQAIAYTGSGAAGGTLSDAAVAKMLGTVDRTRVGALLDALSVGDGERLLAEVAALAELSPDWSGALDALAGALHRIQVRQLVPTVDIEADGIDIDALAPALRPELVQLWYQMALGGRRDLPLAPSPRAGFEMALLRMLAFRPTEGSGQSTGAASPQRASGPAAARAALEGRAMDADVPVARPVDRVPPPAREPALRDVQPPPRIRETAPAPPAPAQAAPPVAPVPASPQSDPAPAPSAMQVAMDASQWLDVVASVPLRGPARELAAHAGFVSYAGGVLQLSLPEAKDHLKTPELVARFAKALVPTFGAEPQVRFDIAAAPTGATLHERNTRERDARQSAAESAFLSDPHVQRLMQQQGAKLVPDSIRPLED